MKHSRGQSLSATFGALSRVKFMHVETYPDFFTPRDEEPSLSSSEEKCSEFDLLEIKRTRKQKYIYEK